MKNIFNLIFVVVTLFALVMALLEIYFGRIPFWYDPARDMLLGLQNLKNPTLIGQPTGIPGVFYGPYWVWLISMSQIISKEPRFIAIFVLLVPYFSLFLYYIFKMGKVFSRESSIIIWLLFILSFSRYFTFLWNPHLTPLFLLIFIYLMLSLDLNKKGIRSMLAAFFAGISLGICANFSMSIGIGLIFGTFVFLIFQFIYLICKKEKVNKINYLALAIFIFLGLILTFAPFLLFEVRHGFNQINSYIIASMNRITGLNGLTDKQIIFMFFDLPSRIFLVQSIFVYLVIIFSFVALKIKGVKFSKLSEKEIRLLILLFVISTSVLSVYFFSKNPVWDYHFIGFEIIFLLFLGVLINRHVYLKYIALIVAMILFISKVINSTYSDTVIFDDSLRSKELSVNAVIKDAEGENFSSFAYSPSIYTFEYDYLFQNKSLNNLNSNDVVNPERVYIIFDKKNLFDLDGFVESKTNRKLYKTTKSITTENGSVIIKRELILK